MPEEDEWFCVECRAKKKPAEVSSPGFDACAADISRRNTSFFWLPHLFNRDDFDEVANLKEKDGDSTSVEHKPRTDRASGARSASRKRSSSDLDKHASAAPVSHSKAPVSNRAAASTASPGPDYATLFPQLMKALKASELGGGPDRGAVGALPPWLASSIQSFLTLQFVKFQTFQAAMIDQVTKAINASGAPRVDARPDHSARASGAGAFEAAAFPGKTKSGKPTDVTVPPLASVPQSF